MNEREWLSREIGDTDTAERMIRLAIRVGESEEHPIPVVTKGKNGEVGVRWNKDTQTLTVGYGLATGSRDA